MREKEVLKLWWKNSKRSKFGRWLDKQGIQQMDFAKHSKVSRATISKLCNDSEYSPGTTVLKKVMKTIRTIDNSKKINDFFDI
ncbi:helix-turn-helix transcriptional regulator [Priestia megaterium]|nr:helix-turn-helix transcriptional regulator [Priestia megaterium]